jgi:hypothetical protein
MARDGNAATLLFVPICKGDKYANFCDVTIFATFFAVPADPILIYDDEGRERLTFVGPYTEHQDIKVTCKAYGGKLVLKIYVPEPPELQHSATICAGAKKLAC